MDKTVITTNDVVLKNSILIVVATGMLLLVTTIIAGSGPEAVATDEIRPAPVGPVPDFTGFAAGSERKSAFFSYFEPLVARRNAEILSNRQRVLHLRAHLHAGGVLRTADQTWLRQLATEYRIQTVEPYNPDFWQSLLNRVDVVPISLALAQAANESAWGTSRFAREGNNYFGQWCFTNGCGLVPMRRDEDKQHEVATFESPVESIRRYTRNLNSHPAYSRLRDLRSDLRSDGEAIVGPVLAEGLLKYSERGQDYVAELKAMIRHNELTRFDAA